MQGENSSSSSLSGKRTLKFHCQVSMELGELDRDEHKLVGVGDLDEINGDQDELDDDIDIFSGMLPE